MQRSPEVVLDRLKEEGMDLEKDVVMLRLHSLLRHTNEEVRKMTLLIADVVTAVGSACLLRHIFGDARLDSADDTVILNILRERSIAEHVLSEGQWIHQGTPQKACTIPRDVLLPSSRPQAIC